jgi:hypothetical protein
VTKANELWDDFTTGKGKKAAEPLVNNNPKTK